MIYIVLPQWDTVPRSPGANSRKRAKRAKMVIRGRAPWMTILLLMS